MPKGAKKGSGKDAAPTRMFIGGNGKLSGKETVTQSVTQEQILLEKHLHRLDDNDADADKVSNENEINGDDDNVSDGFDPEDEYENDEVKSIENDDNEKDESDLEVKIEYDSENIEDSGEEKNEDDYSDSEESDPNNIEDDVIEYFDSGDDINDEVPKTDKNEVINSDSEDEKLNSYKFQNTGKEAKLPTKRKCNFKENSSKKKPKPFKCNNSSPVNFEKSDNNNYTSEETTAAPNKESQPFIQRSLNKTSLFSPRLKHNDISTTVTRTVTRSHIPNPGTSIPISPLTVSSTQLKNFTQTPVLNRMPESQLNNTTDQLDVIVNEGERSSSFKKRLARATLAKMKEKKAMKGKQKKTTLTTPPHSSSQGRELEMSPARLTFEKVESHINRCKQVIFQLKDVFKRNDSLTNNPRVKAWRKELEDIESKLTFPKTIIAVVGDTGEGKSSLMNALLDNRAMLPTSGIKACTATVVEVIQNTHSNDLEADIEFLQRKEWFDELRKLLKDLTALDGTVINLPPDPTSDAYVSYCKICAVYGKMDTFEVLSRITTITCLLGRTRTIKGKNPEKFRQSVEKYIETQDPKASGQYWPIVKHVTLKLPNCDVCCSGAALVDLPGVNDSNAARDNISKEYLKNCTAVWVVSSIHRAIDNKTAKELLGENFRRQLLMDGQYGSIAFICTKTDDVNAPEIIRNLNLEAETHKFKASVEEMEEHKKKLDHSVTQCMKKLRLLNKNVATLKGEVQELQDNLKEVGSLLDPIDVDSEQTEDHEAIKEFQDDLKDKEGQIETVEGQKEVLSTEMTRYTQKLLELKEQLDLQRKAISIICAKKRNENSKTKIKQDFKAGLTEIKEIKRPTGMMDTNSDDDDDIGSTVDNLQVFCCSSTEYQKLKNDTYDGPSKVFSSVEDTQIPALRNYVHEMTSIRRQQSVERLIHSLGRFVFDLQSYTADGQSVCSNMRLNAEHSIDAQFDATLDPVKHTLSLEIERVFCSIITKIKEGATNAKDEAIITCKEWGAPVNRNNNKRDRKTGGIAHNTYMATVRRRGMFTSPTFGRIDFNEQLTEPMYRSMTVIWNKVFSGSLWKILDNLKAQILKKLEVFTSSYCEQLESLGVPRDKSDKKGANVHGSATYMLREMMDQLKDIITNRQRDINRIVKPHIQNSLQDLYDTCSNESGFGMFAKIKDHMYNGIDGRRLLMFEEATQNIMAQLVDLQNEIIQFIKKVCTTLMQEFIAAFEPLLSNFKVLRSAFSLPVTVACSEVREIYREAGLENTPEWNHLSVVAAGPTAGSSLLDPLAVEEAGPTAGPSSSDPLAVVKQEQL